MIYHPEPPKLPQSASFTRSTKPLASVGEISLRNVTKALPQSPAPCDVFDVELAEFAAAGKPLPTFNLDVGEESLSQWGNYTIWNNGMSNVVIDYPVHSFLFNS